MPIGYVRREATERGGASGIEALRAETVQIVVDRRFADALLEVHPGDDLVVLTYFHLGSRDVLQVFPRGDRSRPRRGVFSTRSPDRPNPIGLITVRVLRVDGNVLHVRGLDSLDGSPILDIKSYSEGFDSPYEG
ncbi:MAG: tRNA (N6-threonylcarbamoyladenosine(37)-N6)-methyltransferase TrmO [Anaerolineae bacterium]|nr:tRNA (N6-threonylcarbamoyladenosine(37)-N6)-methyltransferase TrmO [Anaerolineae bacterium]